MRVTGGRLSFERSRLGSSRRWAPSSVQFELSVELPSVRCAGHENHTAQGLGMFIATAWLMCPALSSLIIAVPPIIGRLEAVEPHFHPSVEASPLQARFE